METAENNFEIQYVVSSGGKDILTQTSQKGLPYWGREKSGLIFIFYSVPRDLPANKQLTATIIVKGDIETFIKKYGATQIVIRKGSDV